MTKAFIEDNNYIYVFAQNLKHYIDESGMTRKEIADYLGVSPSTITSWTKAETAPRMNKVDKLCTLFNISRSQLLDRIEIHDWEQLLDCFQSYYHIQNRNNILEHYEQLNEDGKKEATKRVEELTYIPKYTKKEDK